MAMFASIHRPLSRTSKSFARSFAASTDPGAVRLDLSGCYKTHKFDNAPSEAYTTKEELIKYFTMMYTGRRMEILCDTNYKVRLLWLFF
jgi:pyruvate dehydrogenase E1 component alpha subunit